MSLPKIIKNNWYHDTQKPFLVAKILNHDLHPEGLNVERIRMTDSGKLNLAIDNAHLISVLQGSGTLHLIQEQMKPLQLEVGVHVYLPIGMQSLIDAKAGAEILHVSGESESQARGTKLIIRDEKFLSACASGSQSLRWILTPQYLSRRIFLHHDQILMSKSGNPVSWFRTTMFDVTGLPKNADGEPVFKMSYNSRTEFNVCYDVKGTARVRMAQHPYKKKNQEWNPWQSLDSDSTYHLNETSGGEEEENYIDEHTQNVNYLRNKHEIYINDGYVTLFCLFDPAPTGIERHQPGEYSDYEPLENVLRNKQYEGFQQAITNYDSMLDLLSLAKATGEMEKFQGSSIWKQYLEGREAQAAIETQLLKTLINEGNGREHVIRQWHQG